MGSNIRVVMSKLQRKSPIRFAKQLLINHHEQIRWCLPNRYFPVPVPGGKIYLNLKESSMMLERCFWLYEQEKTRAVRHFLKPGGTFVDAGANKGDFSLLAAKIIGAHGKVVCVEPEPINFQWLSRSVVLNGYENIKLHNLALSDHDGEAVLHLGAKSGFHTLLSGAPERDLGSLTVETRTLDGLLRDAGMDSVNIIKIDVEGSELPVLRGAAETIRANSGIVILLDLHPSLGVNVVEVFDLLASLGLCVCQMHPPYDVPAVPTQEIYDVVAKRA